RLPLTHILHDSNQAARFSLPTILGLGEDSHPCRFHVQTSDPALQFDKFPVGNGLLEGGLDPFTLFVVDQPVEIANPVCRLLDPCDPLTLRRPDDHVRGHVPLPYSHAGRGESQTKAGLILAESHFPRSEPGNIAEHHDSPPFLPGWVFEWYSRA